jgi:RNase P/RNase MRP subunit POP5
MSRKKSEYYLVKIVRPAGVSLSDMEDIILQSLEKGVGNPNKGNVQVRRATISRLQMAILEEKGEV